MRDTLAHAVGVERDPMGASAAIGLPRDSGLVPDLPCPSSACPRQIGSGLLAGLCPARRYGTNPPPPQRRTTDDRAPEIEQRRSP
jgi:hypothetical protein